MLVSWTPSISALLSVSYLPGLSSHGSPLVNRHHLHHAAKIQWCLLHPKQSARSPPMQRRRKKGGGEMQVGKGGRCAISGHLDLHAGSNALWYAHERTQGKRQWQSNAEMISCLIRQPQRTKATYMYIFPFIPDMQISAFIHLPWNTKLFSFSV